MLVSSTLNPSSRSSVQLLIIHYNDERVLVPVELHAKFSDLQAFVTKEWALEGQAFTIETDELDVCAGKRVRVHEEAWFGIKDIVGNIYVRVRRAERSQQYLYESSVKNEVKHEEVLNSRAASESSDEAEVEQQTRTEIKRSELEEETPTVRRRDQEVKQDKKEENRPESLMKQKPLGEDTLNLFSDEIDTDEAKGNPSGQPRQTWKSFLGSLRQSSSNTNTNINTDKNANKPNTAVLSAQTKAKVNPVAAASGNNATAVTAPASGDTERVLIIVEPPQDSIYEPRGFRIRREHSVRTVLKGACKAFKIDYTKARLRMVTEVHETDASSLNSSTADNVNGGELVTVKCDDTATMSSLNVEDNQRFIIEMIDEDGEEDEGDGESEA